MNKKNNKGITIIALVLTIIVMLILATITITVVLGDNGLLKYAKDAKTRTLQEKEREEGDIIAAVRAMEALTEKRVEDNTPGLPNGSGTQEEPYLVESTEDFVAMVESIGAIETNDSATPIKFINEKGVKIQLLAQDDASGMDFLSDAVTGFDNKNVKLNGTLNLENDISYINPNTKEFGDINQNGIVEGLKTELTTSNGFQELLNMDSFSGIFDGQGYAIKGINITTGTYNIGLFASNTGTIKNLTVDGNINIEVGTAIEEEPIRDADMAEEMMNLNKEYTVQQCITTGLRINRAYRSDNPRAVLGNGIGGIVGSNSGTIQNCINNMNINVHIIDNTVYQQKYLLEQADQGMLTLNINRANILQNAFDNINKYNIETIAAESATSLISKASSNIYVGGIAGTNRGTISNCINTGNITITSDTNCNIFVGGITGADSATATILNCKNSGNINSQGTEEYSKIFSVAPDSDVNNISNSESTGRITINSANEMKIQACISGIRGRIIEVEENVTEAES